MTSQPGKQTIVIHVLPNILRNKDNQAMKFGQLIKFNMKKHCGETSPRLFFWKTKIKHI